MPRQGGRGGAALTARASNVEVLAPVASPDAPDPLAAWFLNMNVLLSVNKVLGVKPPVHNFVVSPVTGYVLDTSVINDNGCTTMASPDPRYFTDLREADSGLLVVANGHATTPDGRGTAFGCTQAVLYEGLTLTLISSGVLHTAMGFWLRRSRGLCYEFESDEGIVQLTFELYKGLYRIVPALSPWYKSPVMVPVAGTLSPSGVEIAGAVVHEFYMVLDECQPATEGSLTSCGSPVMSLAPSVEGFPVPNPVYIFPTPAVVSDLCEATTQSMCSFGLCATAW